METWQGKIALLIKKMAYFFVDNFHKVSLRNDSVLSIVERNGYVFFTSNPPRLLLLCNSKEGFKT